MSLHFLEKRPQPVKWHLRRARYRGNVGQRLPPLNLQDSEEEISPQAPAASAPVAVAAQAPRLRSSSPQPGPTSLELAGALYGGWAVSPPPPRRFHKSAPRFEAGRRRGDVSEDGRSPEPSRSYKDSADEDSSATWDDHTREAQHAGRIIVMSQTNGRIVEAGTHDELLRRNGAYAGLLRTGLCAGKQEEEQEAAAAVDLKASEIIENIRPRSQQSTSSMSSIRSVTRCRAGSSGAVGIDSESDEEDDRFVESRLATSWTQGLITGGILNYIRDTGGDGNSAGASPASSSVNWHAGERPDTAGSRGSGRRVEPRSQLPGRPAPPVVSETLPSFTSPYQAQWKSHRDEIGIPPGNSAQDSFVTSRVEPTGGRAPLNGDSSSRAVPGVVLTRVPVSGGATASAAASPSPASSLAPMAPTMANSDASPKDKLNNARREIRQHLDLRPEADDRHVSADLASWIRSRPGRDDEPFRGLGALISKAGLDDQYVKAADCTTKLGIGSVSELLTYSADFEKAMKWKVGSQKKFRCAIEAFEAEMKDWRTSQSLKSQPLLATNDLPVSYNAGGTLERKEATADQTTRQQGFAAPQHGSNPQRSYFGVGGRGKSVNGMPSLDDLLSPGSARPIPMVPAAPPVPSGVKAPNRFPRPLPPRRFPRPEPPDRRPMPYTAR